MCIFARRLKGLINISTANLCTYMFNIISAHKVTSRYKHIITFVSHSRKSFLYINRRNDSLCRSIFSCSMISKAAEIRNLSHTQLCICQRFLFSKKGACMGPFSWKIYAQIETKHLRMFVWINITYLQKKTKKIIATSWMFVFIVMPVSFLPSTLSVTDVISYIYCLHL